MKYKVGDRVRVRKDLNGNSRYYMEGKGGFNDATEDMIALAGKTVEIEAVGSQYNVKGSHWRWTDEMFEEKSSNKKIVITADGTETLARLYEDGKVVKSATAKCSPEDEFDFNTGARLAFDRLIESTAEKKEEYYNGKVVCVEKGFRTSCPVQSFTVGKIYTVIDGVIIADGGYKTARYITLEDLCIGVGHKLIPLVEETKGE